MARRGRKQFLNDQFQKWRELKFPKWSSPSGVAALTISIIPTIPGSLQLLYFFSRDDSRRVRFKWPFHAFIQWRNGIGRRGSGSEVEMGPTCGRRTPNPPVSLPSGCSSHCSSSLNDTELEQ